MTPDDMSVVGGSSVDRLHQCCIRIICFKFRRISNLFLAQKNHTVDTFRIYFALMCNFQNVRYWPEFNMTGAEDVVAVRDDHEFLVRFEDKLTIWPRRIFVETAVSVAAKGRDS